MQYIRNFWRMVFFAVGFCLAAIAFRGIDVLLIAPEWVRTIGSIASGITIMTREEGTARFLSRNLVEGIAKFGIGDTAKEK